MNMKMPWRRSLESSEWTKISTRTSSMPFLNGRDNYDFSDKQ
jgi:hypothetical protein